MRALLQAAQIAASSRTPARLATIVDVGGSAIRSPGARLLIHSGGTVGTIGGSLDQDVAERVLATPTDGLPALWRYDTQQDGEPGSIALLIEDLQFEISNFKSAISNFKSGISNFKSEIPHPSPAAHTLEFIADCRAVGEPGVLALVFASTDLAIAEVGDRLHLGRGMPRAPLDADLERRIEADARRVVGAGTWMTETYEIGPGAVSVLLEPILPPIRLLICGIGEEAFALSRLAKQLGWHVTFADPRLDPLESITTADRVLDAEAGEMLSAAQMPGEFAAVIMTHRLNQDAELLAELLPSRARYIGVPGTRRRLRALREMIADRSFSLGHFDKIHGQAGLAMGAQTPEEIALSIAAEVAATFAARRDGIPRDRRPASMPAHPFSRPPRF